MFVRFLVVIFGDIFLPLVHAMYLVVVEFRALTVVVLTYLIISQIATLKRLTNEFVTGYTFVR